MVQKQKRKVDKDKTLPDINFKAIRTAKIHNLFSQ